MTKLLHSALAVALAVAFAAAPDAQRRPIDADPGGQSEPPVTNGGQDFDDRDPGGVPFAEPPPTGPDIDDRDDPNAERAFDAMPIPVARLDFGRADAPPRVARAVSAAVDALDAVLHNGRTAETLAVAEARFSGVYTGPLDDGRPPGTHPAPVMDDAPEAIAPEPVAARALDVFELSAVTPNPVSDAAAVVVTVDALSEAALDVFDVQGRLVARVFDGVVSPETPTRIAIDTSELAPGTYVAVLRVADQRTSQTFQVVR